MQKLNGGNGSVIQVFMGDLHPFRIKACRINGKSMVLTCNFHNPRCATGVVKAAMAITKFEASATKGQTKDLMTQANAKNRQVFFLQQSPRQANG